MIQFAVFQSPGGALLADYSSRIKNVAFASNAHGWAECSGFVPMALNEAFRLYDRPGLPHVQFSDQAAGVIYEGRLEDVEITEGGITLRAFGYSRAMSDSPYTALWSMSDVTQFRSIRGDEVNGRSPEQYTFDTNNRIMIALPQGQIYGNANNVGGMIYQLPDGSSREIIGVSFDAVVTLPANWLFQMNEWPANFGAPTAVLIDTGVGGTSTIHRFYTFTGCQYLELLVYNFTGANYTVNNAPNVWSVRITNVRLVTSTANKVDTTTTAAFGPATSGTLAVLTSARMYVGQRLYISAGGGGAGLGVAGTVTAIPDATHVTVDFGGISTTLASGRTVQAHVIYADEIVKDMVGTVATLNPTQLTSTTTLIQSPALDLQNESYEDQYPADILDRLITLGDNQTTPRQWEWGVGTGRVLYFRPQSSAARTWYIDASALDVQRSLEALYNSVYASYKEAGGRVLRTAASTDTGSVARYGLTRRKQLNVQTTSGAQAGIQRDAALADSADPKPRSGLAIRQLFDANGARWPLWSARAGDTVVIRNLPPTLSATLDRIRVFRLTRAEYHADDDSLTLEPESPLPTLDAMLALATPPSWVTAPWWVQIRQK